MMQLGLIPNYRDVDVNVNGSFALRVLGGGVCCPVR